jgi:hypothetical protein
MGGLDGEAGRPDGLIPAGRKVCTQRQSCHGGRWETIPYIVDSIPRTVRFCLIWIVLITSAVIAVHGSSHTVQAVMHAISWFLASFR